jgi:hypothetical protein
MTDDEPTLTIKGTKTHPYIATLTMDPALWHRFENDFEYRPEVKIRHVDQEHPDIWTVYVACASHAVKDLLEEHW